MKHENCPSASLPGSDRPTRHSEWSVRHMPCCLRVVEVGLVDPGLQVVRNEPTRDTAEVAEGRDVRFRPRVLGQVQHRPDEHVPRAREHHHERPDPVALPGPRIDPLPEEAPPATASSMAKASARPELSLARRRVAGNS